MQFEDLLRRGFEDLKAKTAAHQAAWRFGEEATWTLSQDNDRIRFDFDDGTVVEAKAQIIGTLNTMHNSWMWSWNNPSIDKKFTKDALTLKKYGEKHGIGALIQPQWGGDESNGWDMAAIAMKLCDAQGAYRGMDGHIAIFITFGEVKISRRKPH